jgi:PTH1 family peptidyl-tRNA hydrolase
LKKGGGHGGHNGLRDVIQHCGPDFVRLRLGVGHPGEKSQVTDYVLKRGSSEVESAIRDNVDDAVDLMPMLIDEGLNAAMKQLHTKEQN